MTTLNEDLFNSKVNRAGMLRLYENKVTGDIYVEFQNHTVRLETLLRDHKLRNQMTPAFREALDKELVNTFGSIKSKHKSNMLSLYSDQLGYMLNTLNIS